MGTLISIEIGNYGFITEKNTFGDLLLPFSPTNLHIEEAKDESGIFLMFCQRKLIDGKFRYIYNCF